MKYMLLIYSGDDAPEVTGPEDMKPWFDYTNDMIEAGVHLGGEPLQPVETATTVRVRNDESLTTDGPFAETKEVLGGYYLIDVPNLDDAIKWASACPAAHYGSIEVRPLADMPDA